MADVEGRTRRGCDNQCGCPTPCPGGEACKCSSSGGRETETQQHFICPCGDHCACNPCNCPKYESSSGVGKAHCKCGPGCTCPTCAC